MPRASHTPRDVVEEPPVLPLEEIAPVADGVIDTQARVRCPYCGEWSVIPLDPGSGMVQQYAEDCEVCCRPVQVTVRYAPDGSAFVATEREEA